MSAIYRKELKIYFCGALGFVIMAILLAASGFFFTFDNLSGGSPELLYTLDPLKMALILAIPLLTMRTVAEERHSRTDQLLYSLPLRLSEIVLGKYFAMLTVFLLPTLVIGLYPLLMATMGEVSLGAAYTAIFGYILMGAALIALCTLISSLVENQILAGALSIVICFVLWFLSLQPEIIPESPLVSFLICLAVCLLIGVLVWRLSKNLTVGGLGAAILAIPTLALFLVKKDLFKMLVPDFLEAANPFARSVGFFYGYFDAKGTLFYLIFIAVFLFLTVQAMEARRRV